MNSSSQSRMKDVTIVRKQKTDDFKINPSFKPQSHQTFSLCPDDHLYSLTLPPALLCHYFVLYLDLLPLTIYSLCIVSVFVIRQALVCVCVCVCQKREKLERSEACTCTSQQTNKTLRRYNFQWQACQNLTECVITESSGSSKRFFVL